MKQLSARLARLSRGAAPPPNPITVALEKVKRFSEPSSNHRLLERFLGKWATETRFYLFGEATVPEKGTAECSWLMKGRRLKLSWSGPYLAQPAEGFMLIGYDDFRQNYNLALHRHEQQDRRGHLHPTALARWVVDDSLESRTP